MTANSIQGSPTPRKSAATWSEILLLMRRIPVMKLARIRLLASFQRQEADVTFSSSQEVAEMEKTVENELTCSENQFIVDRILAQGELEDAQQAPMNLQIGQQPNITELATQLEQGEEQPDGFEPVNALGDAVARDEDYQFEGKKILGVLVTLPSTFPGTTNYQRELPGAVTMANKFGLPHLFVTFDIMDEWQTEERWNEKQDKYVFIATVHYWTQTPLRAIARETGKARKLCPGAAARPYDYLPGDGDRDAICYYENELRYYELVKTIVTHFPCEGKPASYCNVDKKPTWKKCCKG
uniref:Helitron_like_N domain-containing protein n=1 Tax=Caenorhabditis japonica TaxID=281687 RepID=A0A8R1HVK7_CAEJA